MRSPPYGAHAVELDPQAHAWAERNLAGTGVDLRLGDMARAFADLDGQVDVVVSNPPYIPLGAHIRDPEVAAYDPGVALWSGADGLDALRVVATVSVRLLRPGGLVVVEHADVQGRGRAGRAGRHARAHRRRRPHGPRRPRPLRHRPPPTPPLRPLRPLRPLVIMQCVTNPAVIMQSITVTKSCQ